MQRTILRDLLTAAAFIVASVLFVNLCLAYANHPSIFGLLRRWLSAHGSYDSWAAMRMAFDWLREPQPVTVYQEIFFNQKYKFQYPVTSLLPFVGLELLGIDATDSRLNMLNALIHLLGALGTGAAAALALRHAFGLLDGLSTAVAFALGFAAFATFYPAIRAFELGQIQVWINTLFCFAAILWLYDRRLIAGLLIGGICLIKPQFSLFLLWALVRREWGFIAGWFLVALPGVALSLALFGLANHWDYLAVLQYLSQHGEAFYANQSVNGLLNRLLGNGSGSRFFSREFPPYNTLVHVGTMLSSLAIVALVLFYRPRRSFFDFLIAGLGFTLASPIAWEHHYGILPVYFVALFAAILALAPGKERTALLIALAVLFVGAGNFYAMVRQLPSGLQSLPQSYLFFAAIAIFAMLYWLRDRVAWPEAGRKPLAEQTAPRGAA